MGVQDLNSRDSVVSRDFLGDGVYRLAGLLVACPSLCVRSATSFDVGHLSFPELSVIYPTAVFLFMFVMGGVRLRMRINSYDGSTFGQALIVCDVAYIITTVVSFIVYVRLRKSR